jgi:endoglucanase
VLTQAARLWHRPDWLGQARRLARLILQRETAELPGMGLQLLPGPVGFLDHQGNARLNPSYLPLPVLRWWAVHGGDPAWGRLLDGSLQLLRQAAPHGLMPDWTWHAGKTLPSSSSSSSSSALRLSEDERRGGYNAIRSYLWLGLTDVGDPARTALLRQHASVCDVIERLGDAPLSLDPALPAARQPLTSGPRGFAAALLPLSLALGRQGAATLLRQRLEREPYNPQHYYDSALTLFALAHAQGRYHFDATGQLVLPWADCRTAAPDPIHATRKAP